MNSKIIEAFDEINGCKEEGQKIVSLKTFYQWYPHFNYHTYRRKNESLLKGFGEVDTIIYWFQNDRNFDFETYDNSSNYQKKDILIYVHLPFSENDGGVMVQYRISKLLDSFGERVRVLNVNDNNASNPVYNNFYEDDLNLENTVIVYCEGIQGNPLGGKYLVRWMLSELGKNVPFDRLYTWDQKELVYFFNYENRFFEGKTIVKNNIYKLLTFFYCNEKVENKELTRNGYCHSFRKVHCHHNSFSFIHPNDSIEVVRSHRFDDYITIFNQCEYFVCYDPLSFLSIISVLCGCICIIYPLPNVSKEEWYKKTAFYEFMVENGLEDLGGISYGSDEMEIEKARKTISLMKNQLVQINDWFIEKKVKYFIKDMNDWDKNENRMENIYPIINFDFEFYGEFYYDLKKAFNMNKNELLNHYHIYGEKEGRMICKKDFYDLYPEFDLEFYKEYHEDLRVSNFNPNKLMGHYYAYGEKEGRLICEKQFYNFYPEFNLDFYREFHQDLRVSNFNPYQLMGHYYAYGEKEGRLICEKQFFDLYPEFNLDFYREFHSDLKDCHFNSYQVMSHYHFYGKEEKQFIVEKQFYNLYIDFDVECYRKFNLELFELNNLELMNHYHTIGFNENKKYFDYDYDSDNIINNLNPDLQSKILHHTFFRNIKTNQELIEYHKKYEKKYYIYNKESFYKFYNDFDYEFYKNKYFLNDETKSEIDILCYYHLEGISQHHLINDKIKFIMYTPPYDNKCGGIIVMHYFCQLINQIDNSKYYAKLFMHNDLKYNNSFCTDFAKINEINDNTIVIYPEIVTGNPLNAKNVVRWILLELGIEMPKDHYLNWNKTDSIYHWESNDLPDYKQLCCPWLNPIFFNKNVPKEKKQKTCYLIKKGRLIHKKINSIHPSDSICIEDYTLESINETFNNCKYFYCYDPNSAYIIFALICGCIPIIQPIEGLEEDQYFKSRICNFKGTIYNKGLIYGYDENKINSLLEDNTNNYRVYYKNLFYMYIETVKDFLKDSEKMIL